MKIDEVLLENTELFATPEVACKLTRLLKAAPFNSEVVSIVHYDPILTAQILKVCNTVIFRGREPISSVEEAVARLGFANILRIVWQISIGERMNVPLPVYGMEVGQLWRHSITVGIAAEEIRKLTSQVEEDGATAFTAGLLHDFGKIMINMSLLPMYEEIHDYSRSKDISLLEAEKILLGMDHAELGASILTRWLQPDSLVRAVANHHVPEDPSSTALSCLVHLADVCTHALGSAYGWGENAPPAIKTNRAMDVLKVDSSDLERVMIAVHMRTMEIEVFMSIL